jgi:hypothetical protein
MILTAYLAFTGIRELVQRTLKPSAPAVTGA